MAVVILCLASMIFTVWLQCGGMVAVSYLGCDMDEGRSSVERLPGGKVYSGNLSVLRLTLLSSERRELVGVRYGRCN